VYCIVEACTVRTKGVSHRDEQRPFKAIRALQLIYVHTTCDL